MKKAFVSLIALLAITSGCVTQNTKPDPTILRVGVSPNSQPLVFKQNDEIKGIEADFAKKLEAALNRKVVFIDTPWNELINSLEQNKIDIIMSGMTATSARSIRINFSTPYMQSGLTALFRRDNYEPSSLTASVFQNQNKRIGFVKGTTSELFVLDQFKAAEKKEFSNAKAATAALKNKKIDMFIYDAPVIWWLSSLNESDLVAFPNIINFEPLAWGIAKDNVELLNQINHLIDQWDLDGTTKSIIQNWLPEFK